MTGLLGRLVGLAVEPIKQAGARLLRKLALFLLAGLAVLVGFIFLFVAFYAWLSTTFGPIVVPLLMAAVFIVAAAICALFALYGGGKPAVTSPSARQPVRAAAASVTDERAPTEDIETMVAPFISMLQDAGLQREQMALTAGLELAKQLKPMALLAYAILIGFLFGRLFRFK